MRRRWRKNTIGRHQLEGGGADVAADQFPVYWTLCRLQLDTRVYTHICNWPYAHSIQTWAKFYLCRIFRNVQKVEMHYTRRNFLTGEENITVSKWAHVWNWLDIWLTLGILLHELPRGKDVRRGRWNLSQSCTGRQSSDGHCTWPATGLMF